MEYYYNELEKLRAYMDYWIKEQGYHLPMSFDDFCNKPNDPWTGTTKLYEWCWKFPKYTHIRLGSQVVSKT